MTKIWRLRKNIREKMAMEQGVVGQERVIPGEPMIYSIKYDVGNRIRSYQHLRNKKWNSLLKCWFKTYNSPRTPVVLIVRLYVSPPSYVDVPAKKLKAENMPAVHSFELCDYILSFQEMLYQRLFRNYRQVVKIDCEKFYSSDPRTVFQFMRWDQYVELQNMGTLHAKSQSIGETL